MSHRCRGCLCCGCRWVGAHVGVWWHAVIMNIHCLLVEILPYGSVLYFHSIAYHNVPHRFVPYAPVLRLCICHKTPMASNRHTCHAH